MISLIYSLFIFLLATPLFSEILEKSGSAYLEVVEGQKVLHLKGSSYERGLQHGILLKDAIQANIANFIDTPRPQAQERQSAFLDNIPLLLSHTPISFQEEMRGLAVGAEVPLHKIIILNLFPEMFHCSGITASGNATEDGALYHVRVLDYAIGKNLQDSAVLMVVEPEDGICYLNVSYAGFIGSVTGMNAAHIAVGEIGGHGYGSWDGMPMSFIIKAILENAHSLQEAKEILKNTKRTCEYYYVISDGKTNASCAVYATAKKIQFIEPGATYALFLQEEDKLVLSSLEANLAQDQMLLFGENDELVGQILRQPKECILLTGFPYHERYPILAERTLAHYGKITPEALIEIIKRPVARESNLHNAIFMPEELKVWISHAGSDTPACDMPYVEFSLNRLLQK